MRLKFAIFGLFLLWASHKSYACQQCRDAIWINDTAYYLLSTIMSSSFPVDPFSHFVFFVFRRDTSNWHRLEILSNNSFRVPIFTPVRRCVRGYFSHWEIRNDSLFLKKLFNGVGERIGLDFFFEGRDTTNGVFANWFSGRDFAMHRGSWDRLKIAYMFFVRDGIIIAKRRDDEEIQWDQLVRLIPPPRPSCFVPRSIQQTDSSLCSE